MIVSIYWAGVIAHESMGVWAYGRMGVLKRGSGSVEVLTLGLLKYRGIVSCDYLATHASVTFPAHGQS